MEHTGSVAQSRKAGAVAIGVAENGDAPLVGAALRSVFDICPFAIVGLTYRQEVFLWNPAAERVFGWKEEEIRGRPYPLVPESERGDFREAWKKITSDQVLRDHEAKRRRKDGTLVDVVYSTEILRSSDGRVIGQIACFTDLTEIKAREAQEKQRDADMRTLIENSSDMVAAVSWDGKWLYCSPSYQRVLGYPEGELIGSDALAIVHPDDVPSTREAMKEAVQSPGKVLSREARWRRKDGSWATVETYGKYDPAMFGQGAHVINSRDVTERRKAEAEARNLLRILEYSPISVVMTDTSGKIQYVNAKFSEMSGYGRAEALGQHTRILKSGETPKEVYEILWQTINSGGVWKGEFHNKKKCGEHYWASAVIAPLRDERGRIAGFVCIEEDVTEAKDLQAQFQQAQKMEGIGRLAGGVAHDFNNLLTAIIGYSEFLINGLGADDPRRKDAEEIRATAKRAADLTRQLLVFSRKQLVQPWPLSFNPLIMGMSKMLRRLIGEDIELVMIAEASPDTVKADASQLEQVIVNLSVNAKDAMPKGGKLIIETAKLSMDAECARRHPGLSPGDYVVLAVSDTGTGMSPETRRHLFEPFFTTKEKGHGTGLGLATCYGIAKQCGGDILVYSEPGRGTTFKVLLPCSDVRPTEALASEEQEPARGSETILLVEDEIAVMNSAARFLRGHGYTVLTAANGEEALRVLKQHSANVHLIITDLVMPIMGGLELGRQVGEAYPGLPILFASGYTDLTLLKTGVFDKEKPFLSKPFTSSMLAAKIREVLNGKNEGGA